ncbi:hypothetical protein CORC01_10445 [Colletotrichum orchidophilum]|uniref:Uncharacterized protein n=1 Tax=Colletotrichum orchidophilum TaxID=1209926 RepID=A0A1G4AYW2_9PEZI|nr:uncharacterized protein CORC01_10445 [Colletotrichum orchidophilum]OHE94285.1 hypothetical protein CORC01_10445 [Colletotrichum orchidophilum]
MIAATTRITTRTLVLPAGLRGSPFQRSTFSTTPYRSADGTTSGRKNSINGSNAGGGGGSGGGGEDPIEIPAFNLRHITSSPMVRFWLVTGFCVIGSVEMYGWYNFGPKILGWEEKGRDE